MHSLVQGQDQIWGDPVARIRVIRPYDSLTIRLNPKPAPPLPGQRVKQRYYEAGGACSTSLRVIMPTQGCHLEPLCQRSVCSVHGSVNAIGCPGLRLWGLHQNRRLDKILPMLFFSSMLLAIIYCYDWAQPFECEMLILAYSEMLSNIYYIIKCYIYW